MPALSGFDAPNAEAFAATLLIDKASTEEQ